MAVRKTEARIPDGFQPSDFGEASVTGDGRAALISFVTTPLVVGRENVYVVFVTDASLATAADSFEWSLAENDQPPQVQTTGQGEIIYTPTSEGTVVVAVRILDTGKS